MVCKGVSTQSSEGGAEGYVAPVHVVLGMAGMGLSQNMVSPPPEWLEYATDREFGFCTLVADRSKLQLSFILNSDGQVRPRVWRWSSRGVLTKYDTFPSRILSHDVCNLMYSIALRFG